MRYERIASGGMDEVVWMSTAGERNAQQHQYMADIARKIYRSGVSSASTEFPWCVRRSRFDRLHDHTPARLVATAAVTALAAREGWLGLDDGRDGGSGAGRHVEDRVERCAVARSVRWYNRTTNRSYGCEMIGEDWQVAAGKYTFGRRIVRGGRIESRKLVLAEDPKMTARAAVFILVE
jgi:hypothetical protein